MFVTLRLHSVLTFRSLHYITSHFVCYITLKHGPCLTRQATGGVVHQAPTPSIAGAGAGVQVRGFVTSVLGICARVLGTRGETRDGRAPLNREMNATDGCA